MDIEAPATGLVSRVNRVLVSLGLIALGLILAWLFWAHPGASASLGDQVRAELPRSGVANPVTAVLLNFRAFDTMMELAVLLLVSVAVGALRGDEGARLPPTSPLLTSLAKDLVPVMVLTAGYLLWVGAQAPGGAFQAGAVLAAAAVLAHLAGGAWPSAYADRRVRALLVLGTAAFLAVALGMQAMTGVYFRYPPHQAGLWILAIETAAMLSIAAALHLCFRAVMPVAAPIEAPRS